MEEGKRQSTAKPWKRQLTIGGLIWIVFVSGYFINAFVSNYKLRNQIQSHLRYLDERGKFHQLMLQVGSSPPKGVAYSIWTSSIKGLMDEPLEHPLKHPDRDVSGLRGHSNAIASLTQLNEYLTERLATSPIVVESLPALRERILRDYDPEKQVTDNGVVREDAKDCERKFHMLMKYYRGP